MRGNAYWDKGDYDRAVADYTEAIRLHRKARSIEESNIEVLLALANPAGVVFGPQSNAVLRLPHQSRRRRAEGGSLQPKMASICAKLRRISSAC